MSVSWLGTRVEAEHDVDPDQFEPGIPDALQARAHELDITLFDWSLVMALAVTDWLEVQASMPYRAIAIDATFRDAAGRTLPDFESIHHRDETLHGLGDLNLALRVVAVDPSMVPGWTLVFQTGLALPTGHTEANPFALGRRGRDHQHMFFGNGTVDPVFGLESGHQFESWALQLGLQTRIPFGTNEHGYRGPGQVTGRLWVESGLGLDDWRFQLGPELFSETPATWDGEVARNSGRTDVIAMVGANWQIDKRWSAFAQVRKPWTVEAEGGQLQVPIVGLVGATVNAELW